MLKSMSLERITANYSWRLESDENRERVEAVLSRGDPVAVYQDAGRRNWWQALGALPHFFERLPAWPNESRWGAILIITDRILPSAPPGLEQTTLVFRPPTLALGVGCRRGITADEIEESLRSLFAQNQLSPLSLTAAASTASHKKEAGLIDFAEERGIPLLTCPPEKLALLPPARGLSTSSVPTPRRLPISHTCEPAAMLAAGVKELVVRKTLFPRLALAVARRPTG